MFEAQMDWLNDRAQFVTLDEIIGNESDDGLKVCVTFDDGYLDNISIGIDIFEKYNIPITWFVCPKFIKDRNHIPWWDLVSFICDKKKKIGYLKVGNMSVDLSKNISQFRRIARQKFMADRKTRDKFYRELRAACEGSVEVPMNAFADSSTVHAATNSEWVELGAHTATHVNAASESQDSFAEEVHLGCEQLKKWSNQSVDWFAYPYGGGDHISAASQDIVRQHGFTGAVTTMPGYVHERNDNFTIPRWTVPTSWGITKFKSSIYGLHATRNLGKIKKKISNLFWFDG
jgi:peptidoglycan/xylan/chitin deacetylase (PgdA/CDA1 family)